MATAESLDELVGSKFGDAFVVLEGKSMVFPFDTAHPEFEHIRVHSRDEILSWLSDKAVPLLDSGNYWREFSDFAIHGEYVDEGFHGPIAPLFKLTVSRQSPPSIFGRHDESQL